MNYNSPPAHQTHGRFDSLKPEPRKMPQQNRHGDRQSQREAPHNQPNVSSARLFAINKVSLADFIPPTPLPKQKYVSPAMRNRMENDRLPTSRLRFSTKPNRIKNQVLDLSGTSFPQMNGIEPVQQAKQDIVDTKYAEAIAMNDDEYQDRQRELAKNTDDTTVYAATDALEKAEPQEDPYSCNNDNSDKDPVCPYAAGKAALSMLRTHQHCRNELNSLLGAQSPHWGKKSLLDFTFDSDDDSNYAYSSESESENDDDY